MSDPSQNIRDNKKYLMRVLDIETNKEDMIAINAIVGHVILVNQELLEVQFSRSNTRMWLYIFIAITVIGAGVWVVSNLCN